MKQRRTVSPPAKALMENQSLAYTTLEITASTFSEMVRHLYRRKTTAFKINLSFGFILRHIETGVLRYYHASQNNAIFFDVPLLIITEEDLESLLELSRHDIPEFIRQQRPDSTIGTTFALDLPRDYEFEPVQEHFMYVSDMENYSHNYLCNLQVSWWRVPYNTDRIRPVRRRRHRSPRRRSVLPVQSYL